MLLVSRTTHVTSSLERSPLPLITWTHTDKSHSKHSCFIVSQTSPHLTWRTLVLDNTGSKFHQRVNEQFITKDILHACLHTTSNQYIKELKNSLGTAVAQWLRCCATNRRAAGSIPAGVIDIKSIRSHYGPGVDLVSDRYEYQEYFLGGKGGRCVRLTLPPSCARCHEIWEP